LAVISAFERTLIYRGVSYRIVSYDDANSVLATPPMSADDIVDCCDVCLAMRDIHVALVPCVMAPATCICAVKFSDRGRIPISMLLRASWSCYLHVCYRLLLNRPFT